MKRSEKHKSVSTYSELLDLATSEYAPKYALHIKINGNYKSWTYEDFRNDIISLSNALWDIGFTEKSNAIVIGANRPEWLIAYHTIFMSGHAVIPIDPNILPAEMEEIIKVTEPAVIFCDSNYSDFMRQICSKHGIIKKIVILNENIPESDELVVGFQNFNNSSTKNINPFERKFNPEDPIAILFTSGTTGKSKGVVLMQKNFLVAPKFAFDRMELSEKDTILAVLPLYHVFGFAACIAASLMNGIDIVFVPEIKGPLILEALNDKHVTLLPAVPQMLNLLYNNIQKGVKEKGLVVQTLFSFLNLASVTLGSLLGDEFRVKLFSAVYQKIGGKLRKIVSGGASLEKQYFRGYKRMGFKITEGYGLTETFGPITLCPISKQTQGSVGPVLEGNKIKIENKNSDGIGEIFFKGDCIFKEYYKNPTETEKVFSMDGWFNTGDLGYLDKNSFLYIAGRKKEIIVLESGKNVYPDELEAYYGESKLIEEIAVFGTKSGTSVKVTAIIYPVPNLLSEGEKTARKLIEQEILHLNSGRPVYKKISQFAISPRPLEKTSTKKIKKHLLPKLFEQLNSGNYSEEIKLSLIDEKLMDTEEYQIIVKIIRETVPNPTTLPKKITPDIQLFDNLGIDSLRYVELITLIEKKYKISIGEGKIAETPRELYLQVKDSFGKYSDKTVKKRDQIPYTKQTKLSWITYYLTKFLFILCKIICGLKIKGHTEFPQKPFIIAANHASFLDSFWILAVLPKNIRERTYIIGKKELTKIPILSFLLRNSNMIPFDRINDAARIVELSQKILQDGNNLLIFPEGTRSEDGKIKEFKGGISEILKKTNAKLVPVKINGSFEIWHKGRIPIFIDGRLHSPYVKFSKPLSLKDIVPGNEQINTDNKVIADKIRKIVEAS